MAAQQKKHTVEKNKSRVRNKRPISSSATLENVYAIREDNITNWQVKAKSYHKALRQL